MLVNSNFNKNDDKYALKSEIPTSLPANGGNAETVDGYHIRCEDVATPNYNWFATFDNDGLSGISPSRAYVGNAGNANTANAVKTMSIIGTASDATHTTVLDWANSVNGFGTAAIIDAYGYPSDVPVSQEGFLTLKTCYQGLRKIVTFSSYADNGLIYQRQIWTNEWRTDWYQTKAGNADTVDGLHASDFVRAFNSTEIGSNRIHIPNDVHVGNWLAANAKVGMEYFIYPDNTGLTGLPDGNVSWAWFIFNGVEYFAKTIEDRLFYMNRINSYSGWSEIYTSKSKPYVTGTVTCTSSIVSTHQFSIFDFTPSKVICQFNSESTSFFADVVANGFKVKAPAGTTTINYVAFK